MSGQVAGAVAIEHRELRVDACALRVAHAGAGPAVLLLHGIGSSSASFRHQLAGLADAFSLWAWDAPGYAGSSDPEAPLSMDGFADAAAQALDALALREAHVVGVSWGGVIATRLALRHPARVRTLALIGSTPGRWGTPVVDDLRRRSDDVARLGPAEFARGRAARVLAPGAPAELVAEVERNMARSIRPAGYRAAAESLASTQHHAALARIVAPTLVIVGAQDRITGLPESRALAERIPGARLEVIEGGGHLVNQEKPSIVNELLRQHWTKEGEMRNVGTE